VEAAVSG